MSDDRKREIVVAPASALAVASRLAERTLAARAARAEVVPGGAANAEPQAHLAAELAAFIAESARRQARGELPPPNPESEVPYGRVAVEWLATRTPDDEEPEHTLDADSSPDEDRPWFGPNQAQVVAFLTTLSRATPEMWKAIARAQREIATPEAQAWRRDLIAAIERAGAAGRSSGAITVDDVSQAKEAAEGAATTALSGLVDVLMTRSAQPREKIEAISLDLIRSGANLIATLLLVRPFMTTVEWEAAWRPYAELLPQFAAM